MINWKEPTFGPSPMLKKLAAARARRQAASYDLEEEQQEQGLVYPAWAQEWIRKYKETWYLAEANGSERGMRQARELAEGLREKLREMAGMPQWAQWQMEKETVRWMEANAVGNVRVMQAAAEAGRGIREKLALIEKIRGKSEEDAQLLSELTDKWYSANDYQIVPYADREKYPNGPEEAKDDYTKQAQTLVKKYEEKKTQVGIALPLQNSPGTITGVAMPESYAAGIMALQQAHPNWSFEFYDAGISLDDFVELEYNLTSPTPKTDIEDFKESSKEIIESKKNYVLSDGLKFFLAKKEWVAFFATPQNFFYDGKTYEGYHNDFGIYMFMKMDFVEDRQTENGIKEMLSDSYFNYDLASYTSWFYEASKEYNVNSYLLVAKSLVEGGTGKGKKPTELVTGYSKGSETVYNFFGIGANDGNAITNGAQYAYNANPKWNSPEKAVFGGAKFLNEQYIGRGQDTLYTTRYNVPGYLKTGTITNQYASNIADAWVKVNALKECFKYLAEQPLVFKIPVFR